jgi:cytidine deaminase
VSASAHGPQPGLVDWAALRAAAAAAATRAHAPYSGFHVGAAGLVAGGALVVGCNVENSSYGLTLCAECGLVSSLFAEGHPVGGLVAVAVCDPEGGYLSSCGRCRQVLFEAGGPDLLVNQVPMRRWLPGAFDLDHPAGLDDGGGGRGGGRGGG